MFPMKVPPYVFVLCCYMILYAPGFFFNCAKKYYALSSAGSGQIAAAVAPDFQNLQLTEFEICAIIVLR